MANNNRSLLYTRQQAASAAKEGSSATEKDADDCVICMDAVKKPKKLDCGHTFCGHCIDEYFRIGQPKCPSCGKLYGVLRGNQPPGTFASRVLPLSLPGFKQCHTIEITYSFNDGTQTEDHPNPGKKYYGTIRTAYLPDNSEGREVRGLLKRAFDARLVFTVGRSITTGRDNVVIWNDVHHKTSTHGGPFGYPDATYLERVKDELALKGIFPEPKKPANPGPRKRT